MINAPIEPAIAAPPPISLPLHLLRLVSPSLPVGAFSYSRGLEAAVHAGWVSDEGSASAWILGTLEHSYAVFDGALFCRMMEALHSDDEARFRAVDAWLMAGRESRELQLEDRRMGEALMKLLVDLEAPLAGTFMSANLSSQAASENMSSDQTSAKLPSSQQFSWPAAFAIAAFHWQIPTEQALAGLMWSVTESQVAAAIRLVPLGHTAGQRILIDAPAVISRAVAKASATSDDDIGNVSVALAMGSAWHETQYSRLFRS